MTGRVSVLVTPVNDPPTSLDRFFVTFKNSSLTLSVSDLMVFAGGSFYKPRMRSARARSWRRFQTA